MIDRTQALNDGLEGSDEKTLPAASHFDSGATNAEYFNSVRSLGSRVAQSMVESLLDGENPFLIESPTEDNGADPLKRSEQNGSVLSLPSDQTLLPKSVPSSSFAQTDLAVRQEPQAPITGKGKVPPGPGLDGTSRIISADSYHGDIEAFRQRLVGENISPDKLTTQIGLYEPVYESERTHGRMVEEVISGERFGLSRGADVRIFEPDEDAPKLQLSDYSDRQASTQSTSSSPEAQASQIDDFVTDYSVASLNNLSGFITDNLLNQDAMRILNVSQTFSPMTCLRSMLSQIERNPDQHSSLIRDLLGQENGDRWINEQNVANMRQGDPSEVHSRELAEMSRALLNKITDSLSNNEEFANAIRNYQEVTLQAAEQGKYVVVAVGNDGNSELTMGIEAPEGAAYNWYAMSDHVIAVGASNPQNTPFTRSDDTIYSHSSPGTERWSPDVLAQGASLPSTIDKSGSAYGTSFAAPQVSATIGLMLEQNPEISFDETCRILEATATPLSGVPSTAQGAGILEVDRAILAARR